MEDSALSSWYYYLMKNWCPYTIRRAQFYGLTFGSYIYFILVSALLIPPFMIRPRNLKNTWLVGLAFRVFANLVGIKYKLEGIGNYGSDAAVVVSNHQLRIDFLALGLWSSMGSNICMAFKHELFYYGPIGLCAWLMGWIPIDRRNPEQSKKELQKALQIIKRDKAKLWIYPEGTTIRNHNQESFLPFKKGAFHIAVEGQLPIIPIVYAPYSFVDLNEGLYEPGTVCMCALPRISTVGLTKEDIPDLVENVRKQMWTKYIEMKNQMGK